MHFYSAGDGQRFSVDGETRKCYSVDRKIKTPFTNLSALVRQSYGPCMSRLWSLGAGRTISGQDFVFRLQVVHYFFLGSRALFSAEPPSVDGGKAKKHEK